MICRKESWPKEQVSNLPRKSSLFLLHFILLHVLLKHGFTTAASVDIDTEFSIKRITTRVQNSIQRIMHDLNIICTIHIIMNRKVNMTVI